MLYTIIFTSSIFILAFFTIRAYSNKTPVSKLDFLYARDRLLCYYCGNRIYQIHERIVTPDYIDYPKLYPPNCHTCGVSLE